MKEWIANALERRKLAQDNIDLINSKESVSEGLKALIPNFILENTDTNNGLYLTNAARLANMRALELRGPVGKAKLEAGEREKAGISKTNEAKKIILQKEVDAGNKAEAYDNAYNEILSEHDYIEPKDLAGLVERRAKEMLGESKLPSPKDLSSLMKEHGVTPADVSGLKEGWTLDDENGNPIFIKKNGKLEVV